MKNNCNIFFILNAFTLAEVLIVLGIIGIVAQMTIPTLTKNITEQTTIVLVKKAYTTLSQAYNMATIEEDSPDMWGLAVSGTGATTALNIFVKHLKITENCGTASGCFAETSYKDLKDNLAYNFNTGASEAKAKLIDGMTIGVIVRSANCTTSNGGSLSDICGDIRVDVNGFKKPNALGKDTFGFYYTKKGIYPQGSSEDTFISFSKYCLTDGVEHLGNGLGCTSWVLYNENLDFQKCNNLAWDGNHKCP